MCESFIRQLFNTWSCVRQLFAALAKRVAEAALVRLSYLEIYQGRCYDLLRSAEPLAGAALWNPFAGGQGGLASPAVASEEQALALLYEVRKAPVSMGEDGLGGIEPHHRYL